MTMILSSLLVLAIVGLLVGLMLVFVGNRFKVEVDEREAAVRDCLPGNNCGGCGYAGCDAVAAAIVKGEAPVTACPVGGQAVADKISAIMGVDAGDGADKKVAFVKCAGVCGKAKAKCNYVGIKTCEAAAVIPGKGDRACQQGCLGFGSCVAACQFDAIHVVDGVAVVDRSKCVACGSCVKACPQKLIELVPDKSTYAVQCSNQEKAKVVKAQCDVGCLGCGLCVRQCEEGAISLQGNVAKIDYEKCVGCGKCAAKCPAKIIRMR
ncbi:MAG: RnfABCDGE type electron transport complex subunit B [Clostridiales bacterium]|nr:RnfABCDGE type electron transport complex subunit B [Clostridiales bacterium]